MIKPINNHLLIEPLEHKSFLSGDKGIYEQIGIVKAIADEVSISILGKKVYFDSWMAAKFPKNDKEFYWLVRWEDIRAVETI